MTMTPCILHRHNPKIICEIFKLFLWQGSFKQENNSAQDYNHPRGHGECSIGYGIADRNHIGSVPATYGIFSFSLALVLSTTRRISYFFTASLNVLPAENFGILAAAIFITLPVLGLRTFLAFLFDIEKVPNPTSVTFLPFFSVRVSEDVKNLSAVSAWFLEMPASPAILVASSILVIKPPL